MFAALVFGWGIVVAAYIARQLGCQELSAIVLCLYTHWYLYTHQIAKSYKYVAFVVGVKVGLLKRRCWLHRNRRTQHIRRGHDKFGLFIVDDRLNSVFGGNILDLGKEEWALTGLDGSIITCDALGRSRILGWFSDNSGYRSSHQSSIFWETYRKGYTSTPGSLGL